MIIHWQDQTYNVVDLYRQYFSTKMNNKANLFINNSIRWLHDINLKHINNSKQTDLIDLRHLKENLSKLKKG
jgi:hypothetical protein